MIGGLIWLAIGGAKLEEIFHPLRIISHFHPPFPLSFSPSLTGFFFFFFLLNFGLPKQDAHEQDFETPTLYTDIFKDCSHEIDLHCGAARHPRHR